MAIGQSFADLWQQAGLLQIGGNSHHLHPSGRKGRRHLHGDHAHGLVNLGASQRGHFQGCANSVSLACDTVKAEAHLWEKAGALGLVVMLPVAP